MSSLGKSNFLSIEEILKNRNNVRNFESSDLSNSMTTEQGFRKYEKTSLEGRPMQRLCKYFIISNETLLD